MSGAAQQKPAEPEAQAQPEAATMGGAGTAAMGGPPSGGTTGSSTESTTWARPCRGDPRRGGWGGAAR